MSWLENNYDSLLFTLLPTALGLLHVFYPAGMLRLTVGSQLAISDNAQAELVVRAIGIGLLGMGFWCSWGFWG